VVLEVLVQLHLYLVLQSLMLVAVAVVRMAGQAKRVVQAALVVVAQERLPALAQRAQQTLAAVAAVEVLTLVAVLAVLAAQV
jgi:hypothetical protein